MISRAADYRRYAAECVRVAQIISNPTEKAFCCKWLKRGDGLQVKLKVAIPLLATRSSAFGWKEGASLWR
jgi:hypothetical protein